MRLAGGAMNESGFFTRGRSPERYRLPHPRLGLPVILLIRRVLCRAFSKLREQNFPLAEANEDQVTAALRAIIETDLRQSGEIRGFNRHTYEPVARQAEVANFDGTKIGLAPDLCFKLRNDEYERRMVLSEYDALFVECKPVDSTHSAGGDYCDLGLVRFVTGDYGWAMQEGMMLAYTRNGRTISAHLIPAMNEKNRIVSLATIQFPEPCLNVSASTDDQADTVHISKHRRSFSWPDAKGQATDITIYHLWHDCG
jgi:hypothetical protein